ncbi:Hypothetical predicted protein [Pelobates cultripes]|uniref:Uncharacterized protein n=1 Tax=Pelobates cultripes TaxID=61616 RepID=A0AAD1VKH3_PELCU|nr:Hypothetical predicted protein [Pelobates cultripes]
MTGVRNAIGRTPGNNATEVLETGSAGNRKCRKERARSWHAFQYSFQNQNVQHRAEKKLKGEEKEKKSPLVRQKSFQELPLISPGDGTGYLHGKAKKPNLCSK